MKTLFSILFVTMSFGASLNAQTEDSRELLDWARVEAHAIDSILENAIKSGETDNLLLRMLDTYFKFDLIVHAGLYCTEARIAAEKGRAESDLINFYREKDINSLLTRAVRARQAAQTLQEATEICTSQLSSEELSGNDDSLLKLINIIQSDAQLAELDINDGLASKNMHILCQKVEHAIRILHDIERTAASMSDCQSIEKASVAAAEASSRALQGRNWTEVSKMLEEALYHTREIQSLSCR